MNAVILWTLVIFAESLSNTTLSTTEIKGFSSRDTCQEAAEELRKENQDLRASRRGRVGENGVDIKALICIPVR